MMQTERVAPRRQRLILTLLWVAFFTAYLDRTNVSIAGPSIQRSLSLTPEQFGYVLSAFTAGYALLQIPGGMLADRFGAKPMLAIALVFWSIFTGLTGLARSLGALIAVRVCFGVGEGLENGAHFKALADTFSSRERSAASGILHGSIALGPAVATPLAAFIIGRQGWPALFYWFTIPGVAVALLIAFAWPGLGPAAAFDARGRRESEAPATPFVTSGRSWTAFAAYLLFNVAFWGFLGWMPSYLALTRHIELKSLGWLATVPYLFGFAGLLVLGFLSRGPLYALRPLVVGISYLLSGAGLFVAFEGTTVAASVAGLSIAAFFLYGSFAPFWAVVLDRVPAAVRGTFATFVNFGGQIGGFAAPIVIGKIVTITHSFGGGFAFMIVAVTLAAGVMAFDQLFASRRSAYGGATAS